jgi:hypothetical protein
MEGVCNKMNRKFELFHSLMNSSSY